MKVVTRFAPSPTGILHIGGARTALFCYLFARKHGGAFLLRIEDTDKQRSTQEAVDAILNAMKWLGLEPDKPPVFQSSRINRHVEVARKMVENGTAYYCYTTKEEIEEARNAAQAQGIVYKYNRKYRDFHGTPPQNIKPSIRLKAPLSGHTIVKDIVQGEVKFANEELEDLILVRSDGTPTYMLSVVVDDIDMEITHVIRGDDHLSNTPKQILIYQAIGAKVPEFAHIPLIHNSSGKKLSKRDGAIGVMEYKNMGYLQTAINAYLMQLGWSNEFPNPLTISQALEPFRLESLGKSPAKFDFAKLAQVNSFFMQNSKVEDITALLQNFLSQDVLSKINNINLALPQLIKRATTLVQLANLLAPFALNAKITFDEKAKEALTKASVSTTISLLKTFITHASFKEEAGAALQMAQVEQTKVSQMVVEFKEFLAQNNLKFNEVGPIARAILLGTVDSIGVAEIIVALGRQECLKRVESFETMRF